MARTRRAIEALEASQADLELVETLLTARSDAEAVIAYGMLRESLPENALVMLANLRELVAELPDPPFVTGTGLDVLDHVAGYEPTDHSYRKLFESEHGVFGIEFLGGGTQCDGVVIHTANGRLALHGDEHNVIDHEMLAFIVHHRMLLDELLEALVLLGYSLCPRVHVTAEDFPSEYGASAAGQAFGTLF